MEPGQKDLTFIKEMATITLSLLKEELDSITQ